ncbi:unnamed protein product, partial [Arabidopsis halleri]
GFRLSEKTLNRFFLLLPLPLLPSRISENPPRVITVSWVTSSLFG